MYPSNARRTYHVTYRPTRARQISLSPRQFRIPSADSHLFRAPPLVASLLYTYARNSHAPALATSTPQRPLAQFPLAAQRLIATASPAACPGGLMVELRVPVRPDRLGCMEPLHGPRQGREIRRGPEISRKVPFDGEDSRDFLTDAAHAHAPSKVSLRGAHSPQGPDGDRGHGSLNASRSDAHHFNMRFKETKRSERLVGMWEDQRLFHGSM